MASDPLAHVYDLALRALAEQERQVAAIQSRLTPALAAGGLAVTLLAPVAHRHSTAGALGVSGCGVAAAGLAVVVLAALYLLLPRSLSFGISASYALGFVRLPAIALGETLLGSLILALDERRSANVPSITKMHLAFTVMLCAMLVALCGLALLALVA
jgi:hypothetical protein